MASGTLTGNTSGNAVRVEGGRAAVIVSGTFGGGTATLQVKNEAGTWVAVSDAAWTAAKTAIIEFGASAEFRINLSGATGPSLYWEIRPQNGDVLTL